MVRLRRINTTIPQDDLAAQLSKESTVTTPELPSTTVEELPDVPADFLTWLEEVSALVPPPELDEDLDAILQDPSALEPPPTQEPGPPIPLTQLEATLWQLRRDTPTLGSVTLTISARIPEDISLFARTAQFEGG